MGLRNAIARLALVDARRFEVKNLELLQGLVDACEQERTRSVLSEILEEEREHLKHLEETVAREGSGGQAAEKGTTDMPAAPGTKLPAGSIVEKLRELLKKEEAEATFYRLLAERTPIPAVRRTFQRFAEMERGHASKLREHIRELCGTDETAEGAS